MLGVGEGIGYTRLTRRFGGRRLANLINAGNTFRQTSTARGDLEITLELRLGTAVARLFLALFSDAKRLDATSVVFSLEVGYTGRC